jgi:hypothetical protein
MLRATTRLVVLAAALAASGCERRAKPASDGDGSNTSDPGAAQVDPAPGDRPTRQDTAPRLVLLEPGKEPRVPLRYSLVEGARERVAVDMSISTQTRMPGLPASPLTLPGIRMVMDVLVEEKLSESEARYLFEVSEARLTNTEGVDSVVVHMTAPELAKTVGVSGTAIVDDRGFNRDAEINLPIGLSELMRQMMEGTKQSMDQLSSPLPEEPVGVGARWEVHLWIDLNGIAVEQKTVYQLERFEEGKGLLQATIEQAAGRQAAKTPGLPPGVSAELLSLKSEGTGEVHFDLGRIVPARARIDIETKNSFAVTARGTEQTMTMTATMGLRIEQL